MFGALSVCKVGSDIKQGGFLKLRPEAKARIISGNLQSRTHRLCPPGILAFWLLQCHTVPSSKVHQGFMLWDLSGSLL